MQTTITRTLAVLGLLIMTGILSRNAQAIEFSGGSGTAEDPYQIATQEQLIAVENDPNTYYVLIADIDLSGQTFTKAPIPEFSGHFNGGGHRIIGLTIQGADKLGLFGQIFFPGEVCELGIVDANIIGTDSPFPPIYPISHIGLLVGKNSGGTITACYSTGSALGYSRVGGLVGYNTGSIARCYSAGSIIGTGFAGGLVGYNIVGGFIIQSYSTSSVRGDEGIGGLIGFNDEGSVVHCYSTGSVSGNKRVGGLVGYNAEGNIVSCYSTGSVRGDRSVGGLVGYNNRGSINRCLWDVETSGQRNNSGGVGLSTAELFSMETYLDRGWDFIGESENGLHEAWDTPDQEGYPILAAFNDQEPPALPGEGTAKSPYQIATGADLGTIQYYGSRSFFVLVNDIDLSGTTWSVAPVGSFTGHFDGQGYMIRNLTIEGWSYLGLFGWIGLDARIKSLGIVDANVTGTNKYIGLLAGKHLGTVTACYSSGSVHGDNYVGGLIGYTGEGRIIQCFSSGTITGNDFIGGLVGASSYGIITQCYSSGSVSGDDDIGGLVGYHSGSITQCYSVGHVKGHDDVGGLVGRNRIPGGLNKGSTFQCLWDIETSGQNASAGGEGLSTFKLLEAETFIGRGWDFVGESANGLHEAWQIPSQNGYPLLAKCVGYEPPTLVGEGTPHSPYQISTASDLGAILHHGSHASYVIVNDIDLSGITWSTAPIITMSGRFDGQGHLIQNLTVTGACCLGLFGRITKDGRVESIGIVNASVTGSDNHIGLLAGENQGSITACYCTGLACGNWRVGGLVGYNVGRIAQCCNVGSVQAHDSVGGLVGDNYRGSIIQSYCTGSARGEGESGDRVGGLVGHNYQGSITVCYSAGRVSGNDHVGGLVGGSGYGSIVQCLWDIEASGQATSSGGGEGLYTAELFEIETYTDHGWDFVGESQNGSNEVWQIPIHDGYPTLTVFNGCEPAALAGEGTPQSPYQITTSSELTAIVYYGSHASYALTNDIDLSEIVWSAAPISYFNGSLAGQGHVIRNLTIQGRDHLGLFELIGEDAVIESLGIVDVNVVGMDNRILVGLGSLASMNQGTITACYSAGSVRGIELVGGLLGHNSGSLIRCFSTGSVHGVSDVGGLTGFNSGRIEQCYSTESVSGNSEVGGLVGYNSGNIAHCYSTGSSSGKYHIGGFIGYNDRGSTVLHCYSATFVSGQKWSGGLIGRAPGDEVVVSDSFWDIAVSQQSSSAGGTGKTTEELMDPRTFIGWGDGIWTILAGENYPHLAWEEEPGETINDN